MNTYNAVRFFSVAVAIGGAVFSMAARSEEFAAGPSPQAASPRGPGAGGAMGRNMPDFSQFDLNKDGKITEAEFTDARTARITERLQEGYRMQGLAKAAAFADIDTNHDEAISPAEFATQRAAHQKQMRP
jgi:hypothetical protein